ncbi:MULTISPECIES: hypothetical protein [unclassified Bradyrhizobium]|uniref:hypothetical protein n=1 Tax=unclassified Bradyrhizobium TaxID=2631580 RepID=UPI001CD2B069|nr:MULTISPECIES: hypothetical protein [unclassified Bradyrhizobium]MCA1376995.1 hypothetical protein [Bradyrhizobium sp. IC4060]MCA1484131.1 hypothetical protein [Bradyrhizobium sp. IC4061]
MSDSEIGKRELERDHLALFLKAYQTIASENFELVDAETPDFIGRDNVGRSVGIELTQLRFSPSERSSRRLFPIGIVDHDAWWRLLGLLNAKEMTLTRGQWSRCERKILVVMLIDTSLDQLGWGFDTEEPTSEGFTEIWLADHTQVDAFGAVDLLAVVHPTLAGRFATGDHGQKPFG